MLRLTNDDKKVIDNGYKQFLCNLKLHFENNEIKNALDCCMILIHMLRSGQFSIEKAIRFDDKFEYLALPNLDNIATQIMYGVCCCRHASSFVNDVLQLLGFNTSLVYIFIDENGDWHRCAPFGASHVAIQLNENGCQYIVDPANNFILKEEGNQSLTQLNSTVPNMVLQQFSNYSDENVEHIGGVFKKYYNVQKLGIDYVYDYDF